MAKEIGLDLTKFRQDMASEKVKAQVQKDRADGPPPACKPPPPSTSTAVSTPMAATPTACANGSKTK